MSLKILVVGPFLHYWNIVFIVSLLNAMSCFKTIPKLYLRAIIIYITFNGIYTFYSPLSDDTSKYDSRYIPYSSYLNKTENAQREYLYSYKVL